MAEGENPSPDGGPAFPASAGWLADDLVRRGMSFRDYFAGQALPTIGNESVEIMAKRSYAITDAMLAKRAKEPS